MWNTNTLWFDIAMVTFVFLLGHIFLGHFEERSPKWRKLIKYIITLIVMVTISIFAGRVYAFTLLGRAKIKILRFQRLGQKYFQMR